MFGVGRHKCSDNDDSIPTDHNSAEVLSILEKVLKGAEPQLAQRNIMTDKVTKFFWKLLKRMFNVNNKPGLGPNIRLNY